MIQDISPHYYDVTYKKPVPRTDDIMLIFDNDSLLCRMDGDNVVFPTVGDIRALYSPTAEKAKFLFTIDDTNYFELRTLPEGGFPGWSYIPKSSFRDLRPVWYAFAAITAVQIHNWYTNNSFCGKCGTPMIPQGEERAMLCPNCNRLSYPQICPSVIVGIINGDKILLTKYAPSHGKYKRYSLVAGYTEVGESLEDTVRREVMEEVGLRVKNLRYYKSQPWSFTDSLLVGFFCELDGDDAVTMDENELCVARWLTRDEIPDDCADPTISLTGQMIYEFKNSKNSAELFE
ncbi:MAG: NAD(+) diphosphatase [Clostridia bacterium]|nr:NAD(+) diphosphatase [Clostridia bacterium]